MIYITQLIFIKEEKEALLQEFESHVIPLMEKYGGKMLYRIRPQKENFISSNDEQPYEIHILTFNSEEGLTAFTEDDTRLKYMHLKEASIKSILLIKGGKLY